MSHHRVLEPDGLAVAVGEEIRGQQCRLCRYPVRRWYGRRGDSGGDRKQLRQCVALKMLAKAVVCAGDRGERTGVGGDGRRDGRGDRSLIRGTLTDIFAGVIAIRVGLVTGMLRGLSREVCVAYAAFGAITHTTIWSGTLVLAAARESQDYPAAGARRMVGRRSPASEHGVVGVVTPGSGTARVVMARASERSRVGVPYGSRELGTLVRCSGQQLRVGSSGGAGKHQRRGRRSDTREWCVLCRTVGRCVRDQALDGADRCRAVRIELLVIKDALYHCLIRELR